MIRWQSAGLSGGQGKQRSGYHEESTELVLKPVLLVSVWFIWWLAIRASLSAVMNLSLIVGGGILAFPLVWFGQKLIPATPETGRTSGNNASPA